MFLASSMVVLTEWPAQAIRDFEYISKLQPASSTSAMDNRIILEYEFPDIAGLPGSPYNTNYLAGASAATQNAVVSREFLRKFLSHAPAYSESERRRRLDAYLDSRLSEGYPIFLNRLADSIFASIFAICGGASLIVPMVIMTLHPSVTKSLITTSISVVLFALFVSFMGKKDKLTTTMAYAAVLVVFVGISSPPS
jgi:hypothetical protein